MARYTGAVCAVHPERGGERLLSNRTCVSCLAVALTRRRKVRRKNSSEYRLRQLKKSARRFAKRYKSSRYRVVIAARGAERKARIKVAALKAYGGRCRCCGTDDIDVLTIDHIGGSGGKHRRTEGGGGRAIYWWLKRKGYPKGFRVLCFNCNFKAWLRR